MNAGMDFNCLIVRATEECAEELSYELGDLGAVAVEQRDPSTMTPVEPGEALIIAGFDDSARLEQANSSLAEASSQLGILQIEAVLVEDDGWSTAWRKFFRPVLFDRLQIVTPWMELPPGDRQTITIDPGQAFGTGGHPTTRLIIRMLEERADRGELPANILDVGCGSGVLALAAAKLGTSHVLGVDIEHEAVVATLENAEKNLVAEQIEALEGSANAVVGQWSLVLANIELAIFQTEASHIAPKVAPAGEVLISGILVGQEDACLALWPGFEKIQQLVEGEWVALALRRP